VGYEMRIYYSILIIWEVGINGLLWLDAAIETIEGPASELWWPLCRLSSGELGDVVKLDNHLTSTCRKKSS
jgi:hypothetical protein